MIPKLHYISQENTPKEQLENIHKACSSGIEIVQIDLKNILESDYLKFAAEVKEITDHFQTRLIIKDHYKIAKAIKADGVHLGKVALCPKEVRAYLYDWQIIGGTGNTLQDCESLLDKEVDYISLGPFKNATNKDLSPTLGLNGYTAIMEYLKTDTPIIGVGNITTKDVINILKTGISGIASAREITRDFNNISLFNQLLKASSTAEQRYTFE